MTRPRNEQRMLRNTMRGVEPTEKGRSWPLKLVQRGLGFSRAKDLPVARPSSSILVICPQNRILLLRRVKSSTSFASAHVFPGGHVDPQDGELAATSIPQCHEDSYPYRIAAIRECFEESGILLARPKLKKSSLIELNGVERQEGRKAVHSQSITFPAFLDGLGAEADVEGLIPFTRWITPPNLPKRYTTQMYLYFLPIESSHSTLGSSDKQHMIVPTPDGGIEHNAAHYLYPQEWLDLSLKKEIVLFPPQFVLLSLIAPFFPQGRAPPDKIPDAEALLLQRQKLKQWVTSHGDPPWSEKCISPSTIETVKNEYIMVGLDKPGPELEMSTRKGDFEWVLKVELDREVEKGKKRPIPVELCRRNGAYAAPDKAKI